MLTVNKGLKVDLNRRDSALYMLKLVPQLFSVCTTAHCRTAMSYLVYCGCVRLPEDNNLGMLALEQPPTVPYVLDEAPILHGMHKARDFHLLDKSAPQFMSSQ